MLVPEFEPGTRGEAMYDNLFHALNYICTCVWGGVCVCARACACAHIWWATYSNHPRS